MAVVMSSSSYVRAWVRGGCSRIRISTLGRGVEKRRLDVSPDAVAGGSAGAGAGHGQEHLRRFQSAALPAAAVVHFGSARRSEAPPGLPARLCGRVLKPAGRCFCAGSEVDGLEVDPADEQVGGRFKLKELEVPGTILTGSTAIGAQTLKAARRAIEELRESDNLDLAIFSMGFESSQGKVYLRLDKLDNKYGSPTLDDIDLFSRRYNACLAEEVGEAVSDDIEVEVSSPGAERELVVPQEFERFAELPLLLELPKDRFELEGVEIKKSKNDLRATLKVVVTTCAVDLAKGQVEVAPFKCKTNENTFGRKTWNKIMKSGKTLTLGFDQVTKVNIHLEI